MPHGSLYSRVLQLVTKDNRRLPGERLDAQPDRHRPGRTEARGDHVRQRALVHNRRIAI